MFIYAQLNENNICTGISQLADEVIGEKLVRVDSFNSDYIWRKYENGAWSAEKFEPQLTALNSLRRKISRLISK